MPFNQKYQALAVGIGIDLNNIGDTILSIENASKYFITFAFLTNFSGASSNALFGLFDAPSGGGTNLFGTLGPIGSLATGTSAFQQNGLNVPVTMKDPQLFLNVSTPEGSPLTGDLYVFGIVLA